MIPPFASHTTGVSRCIRGFLPTTNEALPLQTQTFDYRANSSSRLNFQIPRDYIGEANLANLSQSDVIL